MLKVNTDIGNLNVSFTPTYFRLAYRNWQNGDYRYLLALIEKAEEHAFISGCLDKRHLGYKRNYEIVPASDKAVDVAAAEFLAFVLKELSPREFFEDMMDARMKYYSVIAFDKWDSIDGHQYPSYYEKLDQKYFKYDTKGNKKLKLDFGKELREIPEDAAIVFEASRKPIMLSIIKPFIRLEFGEETWSEFLEIYGNPFLYGEYPVGAAPEQIAAVDAAVKAMASSNKGSGPAGSKVNIIESSKHTGDHKDYKTDCKKDISMKLLGHEEAAGTDKTTQIGDNDTGIKVSKDVAIDDSFWIEDNFKHFARFITYRNFNTRLLPGIVIDKSDNINAALKITAAELAMNNGGEIDKKFFIEMGIPIINEEPLRRQPLEFPNM